MEGGGGGCHLYVENEEIFQDEQIWYVCRTVEQNGFDGLLDGLLFCFWVFQNARFIGLKAHTSPPPLTPESTG